MISLTNLPFSDKDSRKTMLGSRLCAANIILLNRAMTNIKSEYKE